MAEVSYPINFFALYQADKHYLAGTGQGRPWMATRRAPHFMLQSMQVSLLQD